MGLTLDARCLHLLEHHLDIGAASFGLDPCLFPLDCGPIRGSAFVIVMCPRSAENLVFRKHLLYWIKLNYIESGLNPHQKTGLFTLSH